MAAQYSKSLKALGLRPTELGISPLPRLTAARKRQHLLARSPIDGSTLAKIHCAGVADYEHVMAQAQAAFLRWRECPAPRRGEIIRQVAQRIRECKRELGRLISLEVGKIVSEGEGEVQEAIDIADFSVGLSRQLCGITMHSERVKHRMYEHWHPLGIVGVITAFNFPMAVWAWNAMVAAVCGDVVIWKPSPLGALSAVALNRMCQEVLSANGFPNVFNLVVEAGTDIGKRMASDQRIPLISATGSCEMGRSVAQAVAARLGRSILELGGNNALIVLKDADLDLALRSILFGAAGTAGQRCTTTRRLLVESSIETQLVSRLVRAYGHIRVGNPLEDGVLMGPLINKAAVSNFKRAIASIRKQGGEIVFGGRVLSGFPSGLYVEPTIVRASRKMRIVEEETFAPILYVQQVKDVEDAIALNNSVKQGLSSSIFTQNLRSAELFLSGAGSDCGIANVNLGTSGAEIGGAFGGEKDTGGGRESGSDSWKQYMRRQTTTINFNTELPLAQGVKFISERI